MSYEPEFMPSSETPRFNESRSEFTDRELEDLKKPGIPEHLRPECQLIGTDGNAFALIGTVSRCLKRAGFPEKAHEFLHRAMQGDYDHVLQTIMDYVEITSAEDPWDDADAS